MTNGATFQSSIELPSFGVKSEDSTLGLPGAKKTNISVIQENIRVTRIINLAKVDLKGCTAGPESGSRSADLRALQHQQIKKIAKKLQFTF